jgi:FHA domain
MPPVAERSIFQNISLITSTQCSYNEIVRSAASGPLYRLRGVIDGRERIMKIEAGRHVAGSSPAADIHIPVLGISGHHAVLHASREALRVEDLGSVNGTFVDGVRVRYAEVPAGAELRLGPVPLEVEAVLAGPCQLVVVRQPVPAALEPLVELLAFDSDQDQAALGASSPGQAALWRTCLEGFQARLRAGRGELAPALGFLGGALLASGCCVVEWTAQGTHVVSAWSALRDCPAFGDVALLLGRDACCVGFLEHDPPLTIALSPRAQGAIFGLLVWGDFWGRPGSARLLQILLRMITRARDSPRGRAGLAGNQIEPLASRC